MTAPGSCMPYEACEERLFLQGPLGEHTPALFLPPKIYKALPCALSVQRPAAAAAAPPPAAPAATFSTPNTLAASDDLKLYLS